MKLAIFCSSSDSIDEKYKQNGYQVARFLANQGHDVIFGGAKVGIMGQVAQGFKDGGGKVYAKSMDVFDDERYDYTDSDDKQIFKKVSNRKDALIDEAQGFIVLEGGIGTYDELFSILALQQIYPDSRKVIIYNENHYYDKLIELLQYTYDKHFMSQKENELYYIAYSKEEIERILEG